MARTQTRNAQLWEKHKDDPTELIKLGIYPSVRTCFNPKCQEEFEPEDISHIYCTKECQQRAYEDTSPWREGLKVPILSREQEQLYANLYRRFDMPAQIWEASITCAKCSRKLPRDHEEWWTLREEGWVCQKCK